MGGALAFSSDSRPRGDTGRMGDLVSVLGIVIFVVAMLALIWGLERV